MQNKPESLGYCKVCNSPLSSKVCRFKQACIFR